MVDLVLVDVAGADLALLEDVAGAHTVLLLEDVVRAYLI